MRSSFNKQVLIAMVLLSSCLYAGCFTKNPVTGRTSLSLVDDGTVTSLSQQQYTSFLSTNPPVKGTADAQMVARVGQKVSEGVQAYLAKIGQSKLIDGYKWEFNLVKSNEVNAWCLPGGKIVVYSGILAVTKDEQSLAVVMGHEIAHAVLKHGSERMSNQLVQQYGGEALSALISSKPSETRLLYNEAYGIGSNTGMLAFSRKHEYEADEYGLYFAASAGYDPSVAVGFWQRMSTAGGGKKQPEFFSTHPSDENRIARIKEKLPKAMEYYKK